MAKRREKLKERHENLKGTQPYIPPLKKTLKTALREIRLGLNPYFKNTEDYNKNYTVIKLACCLGVSCKVLLNSIRKGLVDGNKKSGSWSIHGMDLLNWADNNR